MNLEALWHDLECGAYAEDLPLWRALAREAGGAVLDVGAGTGRVALDLAAAGVAVVALDADTRLLQALEHRAAGCRSRPSSPMRVGSPSIPVLAGARADADAAAARRTARACGVPALRAGSPRARRADGRGVGRRDGLLRREHDMPPPADAREIGGVRYASRLVAVEDEDGRAAIQRRREIVGPGERHESQDFVVQLDQSPRPRSRRRERSRLPQRTPPVGTPDRGVPRIDGRRPPRAGRRRTATAALSGLLSLSTRVTTQGAQSAKRSDHDNRTRASGGPRLTGDSSAPFCRTPDVPGCLREWPLLLDARPANNRPKRLAGGLGRGYRVFEDKGANEVANEQVLKPEAPGFADLAPQGWVSGAMGALVGGPRGARLSSARSWACSGRSGTAR